MPRFSANLGFLWPDRPLLDRIDAAAAAGFAAVELHWPYEVDAAEVGACCRDHGMALLGINTLPGNRSAGEFGLGAVPGREAEFQAAVDQSIGYCVAAGGTAIHCMAGIVPREQKAIARKTFIANLAAAATKAEAHGLTLLLEPLNPHDVPGYFYSTPQEGVDIIAATGHANVRLMFDCYHVGRNGLDVIAALQQFMPAIGHVQIAAVPGRGEPDGGTLDHAAIFAALDRIGYDGWVGCEYKPAGDTDEGLKWLAALGVDSVRRILPRTGHKP